MRLRTIVSSPLSLAILAGNLLAGCIPGESTGSPGTAGTSGTAGTVGAAGTTGVADTTGVAGTTGAAGTTGVAGTTGAAGTTGTAGTVAAAGGRGGIGAGGRGSGAGGNRNRFPSSARGFVTPRDGRLHFYWVAAESQTWGAAQQSCQGQQGHLVTILSAAENAFVVTIAQFTATFSDTWIGATDGKLGGDRTGAGT